MTKQINELMNIACKFAHAVNRYGTADVDTEEDEMQKEFEAVLKDYSNNTLDEALNAYSPDDLTNDWSYKIEELKL